MDDPCGSLWGHRHEYRCYARAAPWASHGNDKSRPSELKRQGCQQELIVALARAAAGRVVIAVDIGKLKSQTTRYL